MGKPATDDVVLDTIVYLLRIALGLELSIGILRFSGDLFKDDVDGLLIVTEKSGLATEECDDFIACDFEWNLSAC